MSIDVAEHGDLCFTSQTEGPLRPSGGVLAAMIALFNRVPVPGGYTPAERFRAQLADGSWVFVKRAVDEDTAGWLRTEARVYRDLEGESFLARCIDFEDGPLPTLVLEDLAHGHWPPPWLPGQVERVVEALDAVASVTPPEWVPSRRGEHMSGWWEVARDPAPFLGLGLCTARWLERYLPMLMEAERPWSEPFVLCHCDTRSDNLCLLDDRVVLIDWNWICRGPRGFDRAFWSPSLATEGGPSPELISGPGPHWAARVSGFFACRAGLPDLPRSPRVRQLQKVQLSTAFPWVVRALELEPPPLV